MRTKTLSIALLLVVVAPFSAAISQSTSGASSDTKAVPITEARVTTVIENHAGWVGGVTVDQLGYVYVADFRENVWRFDPVSEEMAVFASNLYGASGNTFDRNGNLYQANFYGHSVERIARDGTTTTVADTDLAGPVGMVFDSHGNLLMCNCNDQSVKKMSPAGE
ncbi:MAG: hypothetical protein P8Y44_10515, partial [Acidobacteriota bacterium]